MRKIKLLLLLLFALQSRAIGNTYYLSSGYVKYLKNGGLPSKYKGGFIALEFITGTNEFIAYSAVETEPQSFFTAESKRCFYQTSTLTDCAGSIIRNKDSIFITEGNGKPVINGSSLFIKNRSSFSDGAALVDSINNTCLVGRFNFALKPGDASGMYSNAFFKPDGSIMIEDKLLGTRKIYTYIDCGYHYDGIELVIEGETYSMNLIKTSTKKFSLYKTPSKPCEKRVMVPVGYLVKKSN